MESNFINGVPELLILRLLESEEMYGYQLVAEIEAKSRSSFLFGEGCVYPVLHAMESRKWIKKRKEIVAGRSRYYYRTTAQGRKRLEALRTEWERVQKGVEFVIGGHHAIS